MMGRLRPATQVHLLDKAPHMLLQCRAKECAQIVKKLL
jgi:hypothetical protein